MRCLLDYTRSGRWLTLAAADGPAVQPGTEENLLADPQNRESSDEPAVRAADETFSPARRLLEYTISGHWRVPGEEPPDVVTATEEQQDFADDTLSGLEVREIPVEKWREIAPLFGR
ncbi:MAG TPA: hypothetical protein VH105_10315 [Burkholderiales bacterium]|jgi:hypothetical protein|nr:hypothetical protein [Burkholderiales bacterium]